MERLLAERMLIRGSKRLFTINLGESPLAWLKSRSLVSDRQFEAGEKLRHDFELAGLSPQVTMRWDAPPHDGSPRSGQRQESMSLVRMDARRRFLAAIAEAGAGLGDILWRVVCAGESLPSSEKALGWPTRAGRLVLTLALDRIAGYYRIA